MTVQVLTGWGHTSRSAAEVVDAASQDAARAALGAAGPRGLLGRGLGRSYGDAAQNGGGTVVRLAADTTLTVDAAQAQVRASAGTSIDDLIAALVPQGWFVPVTPGTRAVTVGGAVAADIHGKNHHVDGSWGHHVTALELLLADGSIRTVTPHDGAEVFWATLGGMGLTGLVLSCTFRVLPVTSSLMSVDTWRCADLDDTMQRMERAETGRRYAVAWLDVLATGASLGRGVVTVADHAPAAAVGDDEPLAYARRAPLPVPPVVPSGALNARTVAAFNEMWFRKAPRQHTGELQRIGQFFHPLDMLGEWHRMYGRRGFVQYQFVVPLGAEATVRRSVERLASGGAASFLTVLKRFGAGNPGHLSFPCPGWTLTLDVPAGTEGLGALLDGLDREVVDAGGRVYLAKDSRLDPGLLRAMYPRLDEWRAVCAGVDPRGVFQSDLARRLGLRAPHEGTM